MKLVSIGYSLEPTFPKTAASTWAPKSTLSAYYSKVLSTWKFPLNSTQPFENCPLWGVPKYSSRNLTLHSYLLKYCPGVIKNSKNYLLLVLSLKKTPNVFQEKKNLNNSKMMANPVKLQKILDFCNKRNSFTQLLQATLCILTTIKISLSIAAYQPQY